MKTWHFTSDTLRDGLICGDCLEVMKTLEANSIDAICTDPPYGLSFMGKEWDHGVPGVPFWTEALRVLKPGGHLLAFGGTRTYHRLTVAIEDAGFEIRDCLSWLYGTGFPKSHTVSKAIDKAAGAEKFDDITAPATEAAKQWDGWGTALKPSWEPIIMARKPLSEKTVAENVLKWGTGGINVDATRIPLNGDYKCGANGRPSQTGLGDNYDPSKANQHSEVGRWPSNLAHDGSDEVLAGFPESKGQQGALRGSEPSSKTSNTFGKYAGRVASEPRGDSGSAARFFYCAKASKSERGEGNNHPTVKPVALMRWLVRMVTPPGGIVFDPFMGSGTTGVAAMREGFRFVGIEMSPEYVAIAETRIDAAQKEVRNE